MRCSSPPSTAWLSHGLSKEGREEGGKGREEGCSSRCRSRDRRPRRCVGGLPGRQVDAPQGEDGQDRAPTIPEQIEMLKQLRDAGAITAEQYQAAVLKVVA